MQPRYLSPRNTEKLCNKSIQKKRKENYEFTECWILLYSTDFFLFLIVIFGDLIQQVFNFGHWILEICADPRIVNQSKFIPLFTMQRPMHSTVFRTRTSSLTVSWIQKIFVYRIRWNRSNGKFHSVIACGDFNLAHNRISLLHIVVLISWDLNKILLESHTIDDKDNAMILSSRVSCSL